MKTSPPLLSPLFRSDAQGRLLAALVLQPQQELSLRELGDAAGTSLPTVSREVDRLVQFGFFVERRSGRNRYVRVNTDHPLFRPVREIVEYAYGPAAVLESVLSQVPGIERALIYGSWAARVEGVAGADPGDIDVLAIGEPDRAELYDAAAEAERVIGREVSIRSIQADAWNDEAGNGFVRAVRARPQVELRLRRDIMAP